MLLLRPSIVAVFDWTQYTYFFVLSAKREHAKRSQSTKKLNYEFSGNAGCLLSKFQGNLEGLCHSLDQNNLKCCTNRECRPKKTSTPAPHPPLPLQACFRFGGRGSGKSTSLLPNVLISLNSVIWQVLPHFQHENENWDIQPHGLTSPRATFPSSVLTKVFIALNYVSCRSYMLTS